MGKLGERGIRGLFRVKTALKHRGRKYAVGDMVEGYLIDRQGVVVFEFCNDDEPDFVEEEFDPADFDRGRGIDCMLSFAYDYVLIYREEGIEKRREYVKGEFGDGIIKECDGAVSFFIKGRPVSLDCFMDDVNEIDYEGGLGYEIEDIPRLFNALG